ncbi:MAG: hypothetical protein R3F49_01530 [Planctomycetota bacterium]
MALGSSLLLLTAGCNEGTLQGSASVDGGGAPAYSYETDGPMVAKVSLLAPATESFVLQATLPVPPGTYSDGDVLVPLSVLSSSDRTAAPSQVEIVTRYPDSHQGAAVVELLAHVRRPDVAPGTPIEYEVVYSPHAPDPFELADSVAQLFNAPGALVLRSKDVYGHDYEYDVLSTYRSGRYQKIRHGAVVREHRADGALLPVAPVTGTQATLPHLMGVQAFVRTFDREDFFALDLHLHNGFDGRDASTPNDDLLDELHFENLGLRLPAGWRVIHAVPNPCTGEPVANSGVQQVDLIAPMPGGKLHYMPRQGQLWRRVMIARDAASAERARVLLERQNMGFCQAGESNNGAALWSWWNPETARFLPQAHILPDLSQMTTIEDQRAEFAIKLEERLTQVAQGSASSYPVPSEGLGWSHPWGVAYSGMTGGDDIMQTAGTEVAWAASGAGYRYYELKARMYLDRQPVALYGSDGHSLTYETFVHPTGNHGPWQPQPFYMRPSGNDTFGYASAPMHQAAAAVSSGRVAPYKEALDAYMAIDGQHYIRYLHSLLILAWLGNDSLAKEQIGHSAELFRLSHTDAYIGNYGYVSATSLLARQLHVAAHPGTGVDYGRGEAWGIYTAAAAYALGDVSYRRRTNGWLRSVAEVIRDGQSACTGNISAMRITKYLNGQYLTRQSFELAFVIHSLEALRRSVFEGQNVAIQHDLEDTIVAATYSTVQAPFWDSSIGGQRRQMGVGYADLSVADFCTQVPQAAFYNDHVENESSMTPWAYAYALTHDPIFLQRATESLQGTGNLQHELQGLGVEKLHLSAMLLSVAQTAFQQ